MCLWMSHVLQRFVTLYRAERRPSPERYHANIAVADLAVLHIVER